MSAFTTVLFTAVQSVLQLFLLMGLGIFLQRKMDVLCTQLRKEMSSVIFSITLPCMLVTKVASSLDLSQAAVLLIVPLFAALHIALAYGMALGGARLLASHFSLVFHQGHFTAASALGNCGTIPFMLCAAILKMHPFAADAPSAAEIDRQVSAATGYISLYILVVSPVMWSFAYPLIARWTNVWVQAGEQRAPVLSRATTTSGLEVGDASALPPSTLWQRVKSAVSNPPLAATLTGLFIGLVPPLRNLFFNAAGNALLQNTLWVTMRSVGDLTLPLQLIMLGASVLEKGDVPRAPPPPPPSLSRMPSLQRLRSRRASHTQAVTLAATPAPVLTAHEVYGDRLTSTTEAGEAPPSPLGHALPGIHIDACNESDAGAGEESEEDDFEFPINFEEAQGMLASLPIDWRHEARIMTVAKSLVWHRDSGDAGDTSSALSDHGSAAKPTLRRRSRTVQYDDGDDDDDDATMTSVSFHADTRPMTSPMASAKPQCAAAPPLPAPPHAAINSQLSGAAAQEAVAAGAAAAPSPARLTIAVDAAALDQPHGELAPPAPLKSPTSPTSVTRLYRDALVAAHVCPWPILAATLLIRQVLMPVAGLALVYMALAMGVLSRSNWALLLVLLIESATPPALNLALMCTMVGSGERAFASLQFVHHVALLPCLTFWCVIFIWFIQ